MDLTVTITKGDLEALLRGKTITVWDKVEAVIISVEKTVVPISIYLYQYPKIPLKQRR